MRNSIFDSSFYNEKRAGTKNKHACYRIIGTRSLSVREVFGTCAPLFTHLFIYTFDRVQVLTGACPRTFFFSPMPILPSVVVCICCRALFWSCSFPLSLSMGEKGCAQMRVNTKDCSDALQASFSFTLASPSQQPWSCEGIQEAARQTRSSGRCYLFLHQVSLMKEMGGACLVLCLRAWRLEDLVEMRCVERKEQEETFWCIYPAAVFPHWLVGWFNLQANLNITKTHLAWKYSFTEYVHVHGYISEKIILVVHQIYTIACAKYV